MILALVSLHEAVDLFGAVAVTSLGAYLFSRLRRKDQLRRVERDRREAEYTRRIEETGAGYAEALHGRGGAFR